MFRFFILVLCGLIASCRSGLTEKEISQISDSVKITLKNYYDDVEHNGLNAEFKYLDSSNDFYWIPPGFDHPIGYDSIALMIRENATSFVQVKNRFDSLDVKVHNRDTASYVAVISSESTTSSGEEYGGILREKGVMIKRKGGWKLLHGETKSLLTPPRIAPE